LLPKNKSYLQRQNKVINDCVFFVLALQQRRSPRVLLRKMLFTTPSIGRVYVGVDRFLAYKVGPELADREVNGGTWVVPINGLK